MDSQSEENNLLKKWNEPALFLYARAGTKFEQKNIVRCKIVNANKLKIKEELTSKTLYVQSLPFVIIIKREKLSAKKFCFPSDVLTVQIVFDKKIGRWASTVTAEFYANGESTGDSFKSFNESITEDLKHSKNSISNSIAWNKIAELKDFSFHIIISAELPDGEYEWPSQAATGFKGIHNEGATCYINSLLQSLFCTNEFRRIIYSIPIEPEDVNDSFVFWLQYIFYALQFDTSIDIRTIKLIDCFDWNDMDTTTQQDIHEFLRRLMDKLEQFVEGSEMKDRLTRLFVGQFKTTTICKNCDHQSSKNETFWDIQLQIDDDDDIFGAFRTYLTELSISE